MINKTYTVYMHKNKSNGKVYVGITSQKPEHRWRNGNGYRGMMFMNAIKKYGWDNFEHLILHEGLTREEAISKEIETIDKYQSRDRLFGYNRDIGGGCNLHSLDTRKLIGSYHVGKTLDDEHKEILRKIHSLDNYSNWSDAKKKYHAKGKSGTNNPNYGNSASVESRIKMRKAKKSVPFYAIDSDGNTTEWKYLRECASELNLQHTNISRCLRGLIRKHKGYTFKYKESE